MNIRNTLLKEHSKKNTLKIAKFIGDDKAKFSELMTCMFENDVILNQRSAWVMSFCVKNYPDLFKPYIHKSITILGLTVHDAVKRNIIRVLQHQKIPLKNQGLLVNHLFSLLLNANVPVAIKAFSMTVLLNLCKNHPDLKNELNQVLMAQYPFGSAGYKSRAKKVLKEIQEI